MLHRSMSTRCFGLVCCCTLWLVGCAHQPGDANVADVSVARGADSQEVDTTLPEKDVVTSRSTDGSTGDSKEFPVDGGALDAGGADTSPTDTLSGDGGATDILAGDAGTSDASLADVNAGDAIKASDGGGVDAAPIDGGISDAPAGDSSVSDAIEQDAQAQDSAVDQDTSAVDVVAGCFTASDCPPGKNPCLVASCASGACGLAPASTGTSCDDDDACTVGDSCIGGACGSVKSKSCDDGNACTADSCDKSKGCTSLDLKAACDDGDACTLGDTCKSGSCVGGGKKSCEDGHPCTLDSCAAKTGVCAHTPQPSCPSCQASYQGGRIVHGTAPPLVKVDPKCGHLSYGRYKAQGQTDAKQLLPDFSWAGYMGGGVAIPAVKVVKTLKPQTGDDRAMIQAAIDAVSKLPLDADGRRGAVVLAKGSYQVNGTLFIKASGVVLRGAGQGASGTTITATKKAQHDLIHVLGGGSGWKTLPGTKTSITSTLAPVGGRTFSVANAKGLKVGMTVAVRRTPNKAWIDLLGMGKYGWTPSKYAINHERRVVAIQGNTVTVDIPLVDAIEAKYGGGEVFGVDFSSRIEQVGVEDLRLVSTYASATDEKHGWNAVKLSRVANAWVRRVTAQHFGMSAVTLHNESAFNTVEEVAQLDPKSQITGGRRYSFNITDGVGNLFQRCFARGGRHNFVTGSGVTGPNVWLDSLSVTNHSDEGPHHRWATGLLFDSCMSKVFDVQNRKTSGTGHGWAGAQTLFWNLVATAEVRCDAPKAAMNWAVGVVGKKSQGSWAPEEPYGLFESHDKAVSSVRSLYLAQLEDRLGAKAVAAVALAQQSGRIWNDLYVWAGKAALSSTLKPSPKGCPSGVFSGKACCAASCGVCGGTGCSQRPGGASACCSGGITSAKKSCSTHAPPCLLP